DITGHEIRGELNTCAVEADRGGEAADQQGLGHSGHALEEHVGPAQECDEHARDRLILTDDGLADLGAHAVEGITHRIGARRFGVFRRRLGHRTSLSIWVSWLTRSVSSASVRAEPETKTWWRWPGSRPVAAARRAMMSSVRAPDPSENRLAIRSEEHTSELQSRFDLVCGLLLEKKKNKESIRKGTRRA